MDFSLNREQELIRKMIAAFTENEVKPIAAEIDRTHEFPAENIRKMFQLGIMGMTVPKEYGGAGADQVSAPSSRRNWPRHAPPPATSWPAIRCAACPFWSTAPRSRSASICPC